MTDEEAAAIKERWNWNLVDALPAGSQAKADVRALLAERAALVEIVRVVAEMEPVREENSEYCPFFCGASRVELFEYHDDLSITSHWEPPTLEHTADCPVTKARALLEGKQP